MMDTLIELENFVLSKLMIVWHPHKDDSIEHKMSLAYDLQKNSKDASKYRLCMQLDVRSDSEVPKGYEIQSEIIGLFSCPSDCDEAKKQRFLHLNGLSILYGILRGELASVTGSFEGGKYILPTANMVEVVKHIQASRQKEQSEEKPASIAESPVEDK